MNAEDSTAPSNEPVGAAPDPDTEGRASQVLLIVFWVWAGLLVVATVAQLFGFDGVLDVLDVKRWFAR